MGNKSPLNDDDEYIFTSYITLRNGKRLYAWQKGLKAFRIKVNKSKKRKPKDDTGSSESSEV